MPLPAACTSRSSQHGQGVDDVLSPPDSTLLTADFKVENALDTALAETRASPRGIDFGATCYSASLLRVAIPY